MRVTSASALSTKQRARFAKVVKSLEVKWGQAEDEIKAKAVRLLSGDIPTSTFTALGHPLGKGNARTVSVKTKSGRNRKFRMTKEGGAVPLLPINIQTKRLLNSMRFMRRGKGSNRSRFLFFTAKYAKYTLAKEGTKSTVPRGFWEALSAFQRETKKLVVRSAGNGLK